MDNPEVSIIIPCLNEEQAIEKCIVEARQGLANTNYSGEIIVVDNNSTDNSASTARASGAIVIAEAHPGYGNALKTGFKHAKGKYLIMADGDGTYDLTKIPQFISPLEQGVDIVYSNRLEDHNISMPFLHKHIGNPLITTILNTKYRADIKDAYSGMRSITKVAYNKLNIKSSGWEFALEFIINAKKLNLNIVQIDIPYRTRIGKSKLSTLKAGLSSIIYILK